MHVKHCHSLHLVFTCMLKVYMSIVKPYADAQTMSSLTVVLLEQQKFAETLPAVILGYS